MAEIKQRTLAALLNRASGNADQLRGLLFEGPAELLGHIGEFAEGAPVFKVDVPFMRFANPTDEDMITIIRAVMAVEGGQGAVIAELDPASGGVVQADELRGNQVALISPFHLFVPEDPSRAPEEPAESYIEFQHFKRDMIEAVASPHPLAGLSLVFQISEPPGEARDAELPRSAGQPWRAWLLTAVALFQVPVKRQGLDFLKGEGYLG